MDTKKLDSVWLTSRIDAEHADDCVTSAMERPVDSMQLAMAYVPWQTWNKTYDAETALDRGTISPELDFPFLGEEVCD